MKSFTNSEKRLIGKKLITGGNIIDLMPEQFIKRAKLNISIDTTEEMHSFTLCTDDYDSQKAVSEFVELIQLLIYLDQEQLLEKRWIEKPRLEDFDFVDYIEIGESSSDRMLKFPMPIGTQKPCQILIRQLQVFIQSHSGFGRVT